VEERRATSASSRPAVFSPVRDSSLTRSQTTPPSAIDGSPGWPSGRRAQRLVYLDPDYGLEIKTIRRGRKRSSQYVYWSEIAALLAAGLSVMVYQRAPRLDPGRSMALRLLQAFEHLPIEHCLSIRCPSVNYFIFPAQGAEGPLRREGRACTDLSRMGIDYRDTTREGLEDVIPPWVTPPPGHSFLMPQTRPSTLVGIVNSNNQRVLARTELEGTIRNQRVYVLGCGQCGEEYGANETDIFQRRCPSCQNGPAGLAHRVN
jgi:hypothetical protein